jgi:hypothetical protein
MQDQSNGLNNKKRDEKVICEGKLRNIIDRINDNYLNLARAVLNTKTDDST